MQKFGSKSDLKPAGVGGTVTGGWGGGVLGASLSGGGDRPDVAAISDKRATVVRTDRRTRVW